MIRFLLCFFFLSLTNFAAIRLENIYVLVSAGYVHFAQGKPLDFRPSPLSIIEKAPSLYLSASERSIVQGSQISGCSEPAESLWKERVPYPYTGVRHAFRRTCDRPVLCVPDLLRRSVVFGRVLVLQHFHAVHACHV